jgi:methylated-DNA-protein-cysteine methyltransferase-like protein
MTDETVNVADRSPQSRSAIHSFDRGVTLGSITMTARGRSAAIRKAVRAIKRGSIASYGEVARRAGLPGRARLVGQVLRDSGDQARLPWHRVTAAGGRIAFPAGSAPAREQLARLTREGVKTRGNRALVARHVVSSRSLDALLWKL